MSKYKLYLQYFAEGATAGGEGDSGEGTVDAAQVVYGKQESEESVNDEESKAVEDTEEKDEGPSFEELIKGKYKNDFDDRVQNIVQNRVKNIKTYEEQMQELSPALEVLAEKYGVDDPGDIKSLVDAITNDDELYEEEAEERGIDVETLKHIKHIERQNQAFTEEMAQRERDAQNAEAWQNILSQEAEVQKIYPGFSLESEMQNDDFARLIACDVPVKTAFEVIHSNEIQAVAAKVVADNTAKKIANSVKANQKRTGEGQGNSQAVIVKKDPKSLTDEDRDRIYEKVMAGEKIAF